MAGTSRIHLVRILGEPLRRQAPRRAVTGQRRDVHTLIKAAATIRCSGHGLPASRIQLLKHKYRGSRQAKQTAVHSVAPLRRSESESRSHPSAYATEQQNPRFKRWRRMTARPSSAASRARGRDGSNRTQPQPGEPVELRHRPRCARLDDTTGRSPVRTAMQLGRQTPGGVHPGHEGGCSSAFVHRRRARRAPRAGARRLNTTRGRPPARCGACAPRRRR